MRLFRHTLVLISLVVIKAVSQLMSINSKLMCSKLIALQTIITVPVQKLPHMFSVVYHSFPPDCHIKVPIGARIMVFAKHQEVSIFRCPSKHSAGVDLIIAPLLDSNTTHKIITDGLIMGLLVSTIFVLLQPSLLNETIPNSGLYFKLPALKLILHLYKETEVRVEIECLGYCKRNQLTVLSLQNSLHRPKKLHKALFRNGMGRKVFSYTRSNWRSHKDLYIHCTSLLRNRSLLLRHCSKDTFAAETFSTVHNLSLTSYYNFGDFTKEIFATNNAQFLRGRYSHSNFETFHQLHKSLLRFSEFDAVLFIYCVPPKYENSSIDFGFWIEPFKEELWILLILLMTAYSIYSQIGLRDNTYFVAEVFQSGFKFMAIMLGDGNIRYNGLRLCLAFFGLTVGILYSNCLLSLVVKEPPPLRYQNLKQILQDGYKIPVFSSEDWKFFAKDLEIRRIENYNASFYTCNECPRTYEFNGEKLTEKMLRWVYTSVAKIGLHLYKVVLRNIGKPRYECQLLPEIVHPQPYFWYMQTVNRHWIQITLNRIIEAGLQIAWTKWEHKAFQLAYKDFGIVTLIRDDAIGSRNIELLLGTVQGLGVTIAMVCILIEKLLVYYQDDVI